MLCVMNLYAILNIDFPLQQLSYKRNLFYETLALF
jgi:hypothetical protein